MRFIAQIRDGSFINIPADSMVKEESALLVYENKKLVAFVDIDCAVSAHLSGEKGEWHPNGQI